MHLDRVQRSLLKYPTRTMFTGAGVLTGLALAPAPPFIPVVAALACLIYTTRNTLSHPSAPHVRLLVSIGAITLTSCLAIYAPGTTALDSRSQALIGLIVFRLFTTTIAIGTIFVSEKLRHSNQPWTRGIHLQVDLFPAIWATTWAVVAKLSPMGRLGLWTPLDQGPYDWTREYLGTAGVDWIVASWAVVLSDSAQRLLIELRDKALEQEHQLNDRSANHESLVRFETYSDDEHLEANGSQTPSSSIPNQNGREYASTPHHQVSQLLHQSTMTASRRDTPSFYTGSLLLALTIPYLWPAIPQPTLSPHTTPLTVGCILPPHDPFKHPLDRFITETRQWASRSKILIWPENAVRFENRKEKEEAVEKVVDAAKDNGIWIGMSFEEPVEMPEIGRNRRTGMRRSGFALIDREGIKLEYYKKHLVPITESFSLIPSTDDQPLYNLPLGPTFHIPPGEWTPDKPHIRPIPLTSLICLDLAHPVPSLPTRPALILAPARTWDPEIGYAMFQAARTRAEETGSQVLWCDGGDGAVNGIAGGHDGGIVQRGPVGTWVHTLALPWPTLETRTVPGVAGDWAAVALAWLLLGLGTAGYRTGRFEHMQSEEVVVEEPEPRNKLKQHLQRLRKSLTPTWNNEPRQRTTPTANLIDDS